ncbi:hypothetical protein MMC30_000556 [Trapelia coarctata]|nr:hypothetical protein [Trapelia coarctata]
MANGETPSQSRHAIHRPHLHNRQNAEKPNQPAQVSPQSPRETKSQASPSLGRKSSWITNISSKFSSSTSSQPNSPSTVSSSTKPLPSPQKELSNPLAGGNQSSERDIKKLETSTSHPQSSPKSGPSFIQSALRRLSSSSGAGLGKAPGSGGVCQRRVMNVDPYRQRPKVQDLNAAKLRRVAFCVDVEIAGTARYHDEDAEETPPSPPPSPGRRPSLTQLENQVEIKKKKDKKLKERSEGEALKNPQAVLESKQKSSDITVTKEEVPLDQIIESPAPGGTVGGATKEPSRKKEKKKRSEEERKQRKERKRQEAVENGAVPKELSREGSSSDTSSNDHPRTKPQDRPTTDPLRIYRRCCQLRETPILKRITEQLAPTSACDSTSPGTISCLDLSGFWMQLQDIVTFGDYLAVVPVKKLILENCGLTDEALRVILAGLLAAKTPEQARHNKHLARKANLSAEEAVEQLGVIEKLSLKNNPKIARDGWKYIGAFIHMSRSLKAIDLSMIPFPQGTKSSHGSIIKSTSSGKGIEDVCTTLEKALAERIAGHRLEELVMAECNLTSEHIEKIVDGVIQCGLTRLGLASNNINTEALLSVARYVRTGKCEGLDLGGNDLSENLHVLADALGDKNALYALSLADCNLSPSSLKTLFPALVMLPNFRFIDLSHNRGLFATQPNALTLLRKFLPQLKALKRVHLADVAMSSEHAIALAEILPESRHLAHLNILENPQLTALSTAKDAASQEEACALYASLMAAVRVSDSIVCIDIDVPSPESSEVVKALAKQVVAYSLRNMSRGPAAEAYASTAPTIADPHGGEEAVTVPDILLHLVGHVDGFPENHDADEPAPDDDYIVGGTGVVKALGVCLGNMTTDYTRASRDMTPAESGTATPMQSQQGTEVAKGKAKDMSKNLLGSARKIRARLQPALLREARDGNEAGYKRLQFLDLTLERMIRRFEDEYPECRIAPPEPESSVEEPVSDPGSLPSPSKDSSIHEKASIDDVDPTEDDEQSVTVHLSRHNSDVSLAARLITQEEGQMHRFGQQIRRDVLRPQVLDYAHGTTGHEVEAQHLQELRAQIEAMSGSEIKEKVETLGAEAALRHLGTTAEELLLLQQQDPEGFEKFRESQLMAQHNQGHAPGSSSEAVI